MKKKFLVEIDIPENTGDLCWDQDETGLQAFHDCIVQALAVSNLTYLSMTKDSNESLKQHIKMKQDVRDSLKVIEPKPI